MQDTPDVATDKIFAIWDDTDVAPSRSNSVLLNLLSHYVV